MGVGWHGGQDGTCLACRRGDFVNCANAKICGISYDGGYQEYMVAPVEALAQMPESLDAAEAAPLMCAGVTTFNALRHSGALPSDLVAVQGIGGLGHLGIQFAKKFGYRVAAIGRGPDNAALAKKLGADVYIDSAATDPAAELQKLGGAQRDSCYRAERESDVGAGRRLGSERHDGGGGSVGGSNRSVAHSVAFRQKGHQGLGGRHSHRSEDTLRFAEMTGVRPMIEKYPLAKAAEGYARMMSGKAEFRVVLTM